MKHSYRMLENAVQQGRRRAAASRFTPYASHFTSPLDIWDLPINRSHPRLGKVSIDPRETPAPIKFPN